MNKTRILGILLFTIGIIIIYKIDNDLYSFIGGLLIGLGVGMTISGKTILTKKESN